MSEDVYTPPIKVVEYKAQYVDRGSNCVGGICPVLDPVNSTTGNYYYEGKDFTIKDASDFDFMRYYNSTGPQLSNMFGNGFTTPIESYISYDKDGNMLYFAGDGRIFKFDKDGFGYKVRPEDKLQLTIQGEIITIKEMNNNVTYEFDAYGYLNTITSKEGNITKINYDSNGLITSIRVGEKELIFTYNAKKLVKDITLPSGNKVSYLYDDKRNLIEFTDANGDIKKYRYDKNNYLVATTDKNQNISTLNEYDKDGRVLKQIDGNQNISTIVYGDHKTTITNNDANKVIYAFNDDFDTLSITQDGMETSKYTYDANRNITSSCDEEGKITTYTYDKQNLMKTIYPDGTYEEYDYDTLGNVTYKRDRDGKKTNNTYLGYDLIETSDSLSMSVIYEYDSEHRILKETDQFGASKVYTYLGNLIESISYSNGLIEFFEYDVNGNVVKESDNQGKVTTYIYNANNEITQKNYYDGTSEQWTYDGNGNILSYKDRIGGVTQNTYDKNNNLLSSSKGNLITSKTYNEMNQIISEKDEQGLSVSYTYDIHGNKVSERNAYGNTTTYEYDGNGNIIKTVDAFDNVESNKYDNGNLVSSTTKDGLTTTYEYDEYNREIKKVNPNGTIETKVYEGLLLKIEVDGKGTKIEHFYDNNAREIKTTTTYKDGVVLTNENSYDMFGNVVETIEDGTVSKNQYDVYNQLISTSDALGNITKKEYDLDGNVVKEIDALGNFTITSYDANKNVIEIIDKNGNKEIKKYNIMGQLISESDALGYVKTYKYNNKGQVIQVVDPYKNKIKYKYDKYGNQIETILEGKTIEIKTFDQYGREIYNESSEAITSSKYDEFNRVIEKTNELSGLSTYTSYDKYGNIIEEKDSEGLITTYVYDKFNRKIKTIDPYQRVESNIYDIRDKILKVNSFEGTMTSSIYDNKGNVIESVDAYGKVTKNSYNIMNQLVRSEVGDKITEYIYDDNAQQIEIKNINNQVSSKIIYDKNGNTIESIDVFGNSTKSEYDSKNQLVISIDAFGNKTSKEYDAYGNTIKETNALGHIKQTKYNKYGLKEIEVDERGFDTKYEYNDKLLLTSVIDARGYKVTSEYNDRRQLIKETNANGGVIEHAYDAYGREIKTIEPNGKETTKEYDELGNIIKEVSGNKVTLNDYDDLGRLTSTTINDIVQSKNKYNKLNQITKSYDANKNISTFKYNNSNKVIYSNEKGFISEKEYDVEGNIIKQIDNKTFITDNIYDEANRIIETKTNGKTTLIKEYDSNGNEIKTIEHGGEVRNTFNELNKIIVVEIPSAMKPEEFIAIQTVEYDESSNPIKVMDAFGGIEEKKFDANNNIIEEINKNGIIKLYEYDGLNNIIKVQDHEDRYVSYVYDESNNVVFKNINNKSAKYEYDENNNLLLEENENGYKTKYNYDVFNHKIQMINPDGSVVKYTYDDLGNKLSENNKKFKYDERGNILEASNKEGILKNTYDEFNNKTSVIDTRGNKVSYIYNEDKQLKEKAYAGISVSYSYNDNGFLNSVKKDNTQVAKYEYNSRNEIIQVEQNHIITNKTYDDMGRVLSQTSWKDGVSIFDAAYSYDANDNIIKEVIDGKTNTYEFDAYDELSKSHKHINGKIIDTTYEYDVFGNQISNSSNEGKKIYKFNDKNQVESIKTDKGTIKYNYNDNGNVSKKVNEDGRIDVYSYDDFNQLIKFEQGQFIYDYKYDAESERITQVRTDTKDYHYDQWYEYREPQDVVGDKEIEDTFNNLREQSKKKRDNGNTCSYIISDKYDVTYFKEPEISEYLLDRNTNYTEVLKVNDKINVHGTSLLQTNDQEIVSGWNDSIVAKVTNGNTKKIGYNDYGSTTNLDSGNGYNGETLDRSGLIYLRARYYDPSISRFIQIDNNYNGDQESIASQNRYVYTMNNPYKYVDKDGNKSISNPIAGANGLGSLAYLTMSDKQFKKFLSKKPIWEWPKYIVNRVNYQTQLKQNNASSPSSGQGSNSSSGNQKTKKNNNKVIIKVKCPDENKSNSNPTVKEINEQCDDLYKQYKNKFKDKNKLKAIEKEIDKVRRYGLNNNDIFYVKEKCLSYKKRITLPSYTTNDGVTFLAGSIVSLENTTVSDAFVSDVSGFGSYSFTMNITEYCPNGFGVKSELVKFTASLPIFDTESINLKLSLVLELVNISANWKAGIVTVYVGLIIGIGFEGGFSYSASIGLYELIAKFGLIFGGFICFEIDVKDVLGY